MIFDEKTYVLGLLKSSSVPSYNDPFGIIQYTRLVVPFMGISTNSLTYISKLIGSQSTMTETITS